jgi:hypothetical protein
MVNVLIFFSLIVGCLSQTLNNPYEHQVNFGSSKTFPQVQQIMKMFHVDGQKGFFPHEINPINQETTKIIHKQVG